MALAEDAERVRRNFDSTNTDEFLNVLSRIQQSLRTTSTRTYLDTKITAARSAESDERQKLCKKLLPYFDWYLSGVYN